MFASCCIAKQQTNKEILALCALLSDGLVDKQECESEALNLLSTWRAERLLGVFPLTQNVYGTSNIKFRDPKWLVRLGKL